MKAAGIVLFVLGIIGTVLFAIRVAQQSETFSVFGMEVGVSSANWTPLVISALVLIVGLILMIAGKKARAS